MARKVDEFPPQADQSRYPWNEWLDGSVWELEPGTDFKGKVPTFRSMAIHHAKKRGGSVKTRIRRDRGQEGGAGDRLYIQFLPGDEPSAQTQIAAVQ